jgi:hypothetical protein
LSNKNYLRRTNKPKYQMNKIKNCSFILLIAMAIGCEQNANTKPYLDAPQLKSYAMSLSSYNKYVETYVNNVVALRSLNSEKIIQLRLLINDAQSNSSQSVTLLNSFYLNVGVDPMFYNYY